MADIDGTSGNDTLNGTTDADTIDGGGGNDTIDGGAGNDEVYGDSNNLSAQPADTTNTTVSNNFQVISLGYFGTDIDPTETGGTTGISENGGLLNGATYGSTGDPLSANVVNLAPGTGNGDGQYDGDENVSSDTFFINGVEYTFDSSAVYNGTIVTFEDGTTATVSAVVFQDTAGNLYLAPESFNNADTAIYTSQPITSIQLGTQDTSGSFGNGLTAARVTDSWVESSEVVLGPDGDDTIDGGAGDDRIFGEGGNDSITGGSGNDTIYGDNTESQVIGDDFSNGDWSGSATLDSTRATFSADNQWTNALTTTPSGMSSGNGAGGGAQITLDFVWSNGSPTGSGSADFYIDYGGVNYVQITTPADGSAATITYYNGATGPAGPIPEGDVFGGTGYFTLTFDLPPGVPDSGELEFWADTTGGVTDDFAIDNVTVIRDGHMEPGDDTIDGGGGDDTIDGGDGDDTIDGGSLNIAGEYTEQTGTSDSFTGTNGNSDFTGTTTSNEGQVSTFSNAGLNGYWVGNGDGNETHTHTFSQEVAGVRVDFNAINSGEYLSFEIDGVPVDLNTLIANGDAVFDGANAYGIDGSGRVIETGPDNNATVGSVTFLRPLTEIDVISSVDSFGSGIVYEMFVDTNPPTYSDDDVLSGGTGSDTFIIKNAFGNDTIFGGEDPDGLDIDTIDASGITTGGVTVTVTNESGSVTQGADSASFSDIESFTLTDQDDSFTAFGTDDVTVDGGAGDDTFQEGNGNNTLFGGAGNDTFEVGYGTSTIDGGTGTDTLSAAASNDPISVTFNGTGSGTYTDLSDSDSGTFSNIESVQGSGRDDSINAAADSGGVTLAGGAGNDTITGGFGDDIITGDAGSDTIAGGAGNDSLDGGDGRDRVVFDGNHNDYTYDIIGPGQITVTHIETGDVDTVTGFEEIQFADGLFDLVIGTDGDDTLIHDGAGIGQDNDFMIGGDGTDTFNSGSGNDVVFGGAGNDTLDGGTGDDSLYGGSGSDSINAGDGTDTVYGGDGNDVLDGGPGNDTVFGGIGSDTILLNDGYLGDSIVGGEDPDSLDVDTLDMSGITNDGVDITLSGNESGAVSSTEGTANFSEIESFSLTDQDDTFNGGAATSSITVDGGAGNDSLAGGSGNDTLDGGAGADTLTGGAGADVFVAGGAADIITDFDTTTGIDGGTNADNDYVDLTSYYNQANLDAWNLANPGQTYATPLGWLRADQADNGVMNQAGGLQIQAGGAAVAASELNAENTGVVCYASGTLIETPSGLTPVEHLKVGDIVITRDNGPQLIAWTGRRDLTSETLVRFPQLKPIWLSARFFGLEDNLIVSPQHGILIRQPERGGTERLFRATHLADLQGGGARRMHGCKQISYHHLMFETHQIIRANGIWSESLYPGQMALSSLHAGSLPEIIAIFPELENHEAPKAYGAPAREYSRRGKLPDSLAELMEKAEEPVFSGQP